MNRSLILITVLFIAVAGFLVSRRTSKNAFDLRGASTSKSQDTSAEIAPQNEQTPTSLAKRSAISNKSLANTSASRTDESRKLQNTDEQTPIHGESAPSLTHEFKVEDGVAVVDGDIVVGDAPSGKSSGSALLSALSLWPTHEIPYFIQPSLSDPARVTEAIRLFEGTSVQFVPYTNQPDVLVFQEGTRTCKSYMGRIGGKQPIFLAPACGPYEIAHELMHALGFVHEQNRFDRDHFLKINKENIDERYLVNFERMPAEFMRLSGSTEFGYDSIMIYPPFMFSKNGRPTMEPIVDGKQINPSHTLSADDIARVNAYYGAR
jgi:hypothetical protein